MTTRFFKSITFSIVFALSTLSAQAQSRKTVKIGLIFPLTGAMSSFGEDVAKALPLLERKFNSEQSRYEFKLKIEDGMFGQGNAAVSAAKKLIDIEGVKFLVVGSSGEVLQVAPIAEDAQVLLVAGFASHPAIRGAGDYIFRTYIDIDRGLQPVVNDISKRGIDRVAVITEISSFTSAVVDSLKSKLGDKIVSADDYLVGEGDLSGIIVRARSKNPQAYYLNATVPGSFINLFKRLRENGVRAPIYTYYTASLTEVQEALGRDLDGTRYLDFPTTDAPSDDFQTFVMEFENVLGTKPKAMFNFRTNYNAIKVVYDSIVAVGSDPTKAKDFLYKYDSPSATGRLRFDSNGDAIDLNLVLKIYGESMPGV